jgi:pyruvate/2-oxoglutarate dehydrogenase complex dihydrolipoamide acyltransferase (E2) component
MRVPITVPQLGLVESVVLVEWLVPDGGGTQQGEPILVVETDKAETEIIAPATGTVEIVIQAGDADVPVGTHLGYIDPP